ncbi:MAG: hypothetical protein ACRDPH_04340 [Marmoricola sp.]
MSRTLGLRSVDAINPDGKEAEMSWEETHRRWTALREIAAIAEFRQDGELPWNQEYAEIFGDPDQLVAALRYRWELNATAQLDDHLPEDQLDETRRRLVAENAGVRRILARYSAATDHGGEEERLVSA